MTNNQKLTRSQSIFILFLALILTMLLVVMGIMIWPDVSMLVFSTTSSPIVTLISNTEVVHFVISPKEWQTPTERPTPTTRIMQPTWTPIDTHTPLTSLTSYINMTTTPLQTYVNTPTKTITTLNPIITTTLIPPTSIATARPTNSSVPPTHIPIPTNTKIIEKVTCGVSPSVVPGATISIVTFYANFTPPKEGLGFSVNIYPYYPGQKMCSGGDGDGDGYASCEGRVGEAAYRKTITVTFDTSVGLCYATYKTQ